jgi:hypothetical protein
MNTSIYKNLINCSLLYYILSIDNPNDRFPQTVKTDALKRYNDILHHYINNGRYVMIVEHNLKDPRQFTIVKDCLYPEDTILEGAKLVFESPEEFNRVFPQFSALPPVHIPTNMEQDPVTGELRPKHIDPYRIIDHHEDPGQLVLDMGSDIDIGAIWISFATEDNIVSIATSTTKQFLNGKRFHYIAHLINKKHGKDGHYNLVTDGQDTELIKARYIAIVTKDRIENVAVTKARVIENNNTLKL